MATIENLDDVIHQKVRLGVMSCLMASGETDFNFLKNALGVSDGNLSTHLTVLEESGYIEVRKEFVGKKPRTAYLPTDSGRRAFEAYVAALESLVYGNALGNRDAATGRETPQSAPQRTVERLRDERPRDRPLRPRTT